MDDTTPILSEVLLNPGSSRWLRITLQGVLAGDRDPFDSARDARLLAALLQERARTASLTQPQRPAGRAGPHMVDLLLPLTDTDPLPAWPQVSQGVR